MATDIAINPDRFQTFFGELEKRKTLLTKITDLHKTITTHFESIDQSLSKKSQTLDSQIEAFNVETKTAFEELEKRENAIPERESDLAAKIDEQKASAIEDIVNFDHSVSVGEKSLSDILKIYCKRMDSGGLLRFLLAKRKESVALRSEIATAVEEAVDSMRLVLDAVEEFVGMKVEGKVGMADRRWACGMLIQAAVPIGESSGSVGRSLKERAAGVLEKWKGVLGGGEGSGGVGASEATMFLQMVIGFGLKEKFEDDFLRKLVVDFAARRDMPKLAVALGFGDKIGDIIGDLVNSGKEIEAIYFAFESGLTERFPPVELLKTSLRNCRKMANSISQRGKHSMASVERANNLELDATKAIIKCVDDYKLEKQFGIDSLRKRITQLEKARADKKKGAASTSKPSNKRPHGGSGRGSGPPSFRSPKAGRFSNASPSLRHRNPPQSHQAPATRFSAPYTYPSHSVYEAPAGGPYAQGYGGTHSQSPAALPQQYSYPPQAVTAGGVGGGGSYGQGSYGGQNNYVAYDYGAAAAAAAAPTYPPSYQQ
ncbi:unnamed protein product [Ilex paraguariensis]|uniref:FRIGIDA-like protein n=1 Tax=Ilex paraguariensis TaxID=185542 RepID=A0ABC8T5S2_9AQUA